MERSAASTEPLRGRTVGLVSRFGWNVLSSQVLRPGFRYWQPGADAAVAYVDTGGAWVAAGAPIAAQGRLREVADGFVAAARSEGRRAAFFGVEGRFLQAVPCASHLIGHQPVWDPTCWPVARGESASLRAQLRRAERKGVRVEELSPDRAGELPAQLLALRAAWLSSRPLAPMGFLVDAHLTGWSPRRTFVAAQGRQIVGVASVLSVPAREGFFIEHLWRAPASPNGTVELLVDVAMTTFASESVRWATLGLAPLHGADSPWLRALRGLARPLYDFGGLAAFKAKLRPGRWDPIHLAYPQGAFALTAFFDVAVAFAGGSLLGYAARSLRHRLGALAVRTTPRRFPLR